MAGAVDDEPGRAVADGAGEHDDCRHGLPGPRHAVDQQKVVGVLRVERVEPLQCPAGQREPERDSIGAAAAGADEGECVADVRAQVLAPPSGQIAAEWERRPPERGLREGAVLDAGVACHCHLATCGLAEFA